MKPITVDQLIEKLTKLKAEYGGDCKVMACVPYEDGFAWRYEYVEGASFHNGNIDLPITLNYKTDDERLKEKAEQAKTHPTLHLDNGVLKVFQKSSPFPRT